MATNDFRNEDRQRAKWERHISTPLPWQREGQGGGSSEVLFSTMIKYRSEEEKIVALYLANALGDQLAKNIIQNGEVANADEATHLSKFFWAMVNKSAEGGVELPSEGGSQYWIEKLYNSTGGYLERAGYEAQWNEEIDKA